MEKFAVIDIGSNSVRLALGADGRILYKHLRTTRLGEGIAQTPVLKEEAIARTSQAVAEFFHQAQEEGARKIFAFATAAVRSAENRAIFLDRVKSLCGVEVEVISGEEEAAIGVLGAHGNKDGAVIDIGGASTELVLQKEGKILYKKSVNIGVVRLKDCYGRDRKALQEACVEASAQFADFPQVDLPCAIGGTATTLAAQALGLREYDPKKVTGAVLSVKTLNALADKLSLSSVEEIAALPCMPTGRADVITGGAIWLVTLVKALGAERITVSDNDNLEGYAVKKGLMKGI